MGKKERRKLSVVKETNANALSNEQEQLYLIQIKDLTSKLERKNQLTEELQKSNEEYKQKYAAEVKDKDDIVSYMKHTIDNFAAEIDHLKEKIIGLQNEHETEKKHLENKLITAKEEYTKTLENLKEENLTMSGKLASLEEFESEKENLYKEHENLKTKYKEEIQNYEEKILNLQQKYVLDCDRLKRDYEDKQKATKEYYFSDEQIEYTIKTAFSQIKKLKKELYDNSEMTLKLTKENEILKYKNSVLKQKLNIFETTESNLASKIEAQQKAIMLLKKKCTEQKDLLEKLKNIEKCYEALVKQEEASKTQINELTVNVVSMSSNLAEINKQLEFYKSEIKMQEEANVKLIIIILKAAKAIKEAIGHIPKNEEEKELYSQKRDELLHNLCSLLESSNEFYNDYYFDFLHSHGISSEEIKKLFEEKDIPPKYKLGNLGFVPKTEQIKYTKNEKSNITHLARTFSELQLREKAILSSVNLLTVYEDLVKKLSQDE